MSEYTCRTMILKYQSLMPDFNASRPHLPIMKFNMKKMNILNELVAIESHELLAILATSMSRKKHSRNRLDELYRKIMIGFIFLIVYSEVAR